MIRSLQQEALSHGDRLQVIPKYRIHDLCKEIELFSKGEELNGFQRWIVSSLYHFDTPALEFDVSSVLLIAVPHPAYAKIDLEWQGKKYNFVSLIMSDFDKVEKYLVEFLGPKGYHIISAPDLPLKRLSVKSGLAVYGRNNICYVEGMGSYFSLAAYFSDMPCDEQDNWTEMRTASACFNCRICFNKCPTGAIRQERFLIDNEKCLSYFNEGPGEFPDWLPKSAHHCLYDCLKCQINCPMNRDYNHNVAGPIPFSEDETGLILSEASFESYPPALRNKFKILGLDKWFHAIPRNLKTLLEAENTPVG